MNDLETLSAMFDRTGIPYTLDVRQSVTKLTVTADGGDDDAPNAGYCSFYTVYKFDDAGTLVSTGVWE